MQKQKGEDLLVKHTKTLNSEQLAAFSELLEFVDKKNEPGLVCLKGYAGTGKTYLITQFITYYLEVNKRKQVVLTAPTNKAVQVLKESSSKELRTKGNIQFITIHKLLGVKQVINDDGTESFQSVGSIDIYGVHIVVVDEVSMLADDLFFKLIEFQDNVKIIFMGDPCQIPPVGKIDCEPFLNPRKHGVHNIELSKIMRQDDGSKLVEVSFEIRENIRSWNTTWLKDRNGFDLTILHNNTIDKRASIRTDMESFFSSEEFKSNAGMYKVIAWRNVRVDWYNRFIRSVFHGKKENELPEYMEKDRLVMNAPVTDGEMIRLNTNQEVEVISVVDSTFEVEGINLFGYAVMTKYYDVDIEADVEEEIRLIRFSEKPKFKAILDRIADTAKYTPDAMKRKWHWKRFYEVKGFFADVSYAFAITAHKSQGSTYKMIWVDLNDMSLNGNTVERNRIIYTAITRAKSMCNIITQ